MKQLLALIMAVVSAGSPVVVGGCTQPVPDNTATYAVAQAVYPEMAPYPDEMSFFDPVTGEYDDEGFSSEFDAWWESVRRQETQMSTEDQAGLEPFLTAGIQPLLGAEDGQNHVFSPLNIYLALGMLAELTDGNSRQQILDLLGADSIEALRSSASALWNAAYRDDGAVSSVLAASLWLNQYVPFDQETMDTVAETYYASSYRGEMGSEAFDKALQSWLNDQTGGLLEDQISGLSMDPETVLALATTIYFRAKWTDEFSETATAPQTFHSPEGDVTCDFMHQSGSQNYYWGENFSSVAHRLENGGAMWLILPDEGVSVNELLADQEVMAFLLSCESWDNSKYLTVNLSVPKFDVTSQLDLTPALQSMGVTDVFDPKVSDFTPMTDALDQIFISQAEHDARVTIDEKGCTAVAYTVMMAAGAGMPPEETVDFVVDRPFLFTITGPNDLPLFVGIVNQPV